MLFGHFIPYLEYPPYFCTLLVTFNWKKQFYILHPSYSWYFSGFWDEKRSAYHFCIMVLMCNSYTTDCSGTITLKDHFYKFFLWRFLEIFMGAILALSYKRGISKEHFNIDSNKYINGLIRFYTSPVTLFISVVVFLWIIFEPLPIAYNLPYYAFAFASGVIILHTTSEK